MGIDYQFREVGMSVASNSGKKKICESFIIIYDIIIYIYKSRNKEKFFKIAFYYILSSLSF